MIELLPIRYGEPYDGESLPEITKTDIIKKINEIIVQIAIIEERMKQND